MKIAVITVNYHNQEETVACIKSFSKSKSGESNLYFYVVDNGSTSNSFAHLTKNLAGVKIIRSTTNLGFAGGNNLGIKQALKDGADYVLLINPDSLIDSKDFVSELLKENSDIAAPVIKYNKDGQNTYDFGGVVDHKFGRNTHLTSRKLKLPSQLPDYFTGACLLIKAKVFKRIGYLDDSYFLYYEDADFCLRAVKAGFTQKIAIKAILFHHLSTTTSKLGKGKLWILAQSHLLFCRKHLSVMASPLYLIFNLFLRVKFFLG